jgi:hypothetical protein
MTQRVECPGCRRTLAVPDWTEGPWVTCPRCLARVPNPAAADSYRPEWAGRRRCPRCGKEVERLWVSCPFCEEPLRGGGLDLDVRRDRRATNVFVILLAVVGAIGIALMTAQAAMAAANPYYPQYGPLITLTVGLLFLTGLVTFIVFLRSGGRPGAAGVRRVVVGTLATAGAVIGGGVLLCLTLLVFFLALCAANGCKV